MGVLIVKSIMGEGKLSTLTWEEEIDNCLKSFQIVICD